MKKAIRFLIKHGPSIVLTVLLIFCAVLLSWALYLVHSGVWVATRSKVWTALTLPIGALIGYASYLVILGLHKAYERLEEWVKE